MWPPRYEYLQANAHLITLDKRCRFNRSVQQYPQVYPPASDSRVSCAVWCSGVAQSHRETLAVARQVVTPGGEYCRSKPLVFSFVPLCHGLRGSQKYTCRLFPRDPDQADVARAPLHQRCDIGIARTHEQVAFPVSRHRAVLDGGRAFANRDGVDDMPARVGRRAFRPSIGSSLASASRQRYRQAALAAVRRLRVAHQYRRGLLRSPENGIIERLLLRNQLRWAREIIRNPNMGDAYPSPT